MSCVSWHTLSSTSTSFSILVPPLHSLPHPPSSDPFYRVVIPDDASDSELDPGPGHRGIEPCPPTPSSQSDLSSRSDQLPCVPRSRWPCVPSVCCRLPCSSAPRVNRVIRRVRLTIPDRRRISRFRHSPRTSRRSGSWRGAPTVRSGLPSEVVASRG